MMMMMMTMMTMMTMMRMMRTSIVVNLKHTGSAQCFLKGTERDKI